MNTIIKTTLLLALTISLGSLNAQTTLTPAQMQAIIKQVRAEILDSLRADANANIQPVDTSSNELPLHESKQKGDGFEGIDQTWQNGSDRREKNIWSKLKYFTPSIMADLNYNYSFQNPIDNTVVGSTALARR